MDIIGKPERITQNRIIALFRDELDFRYLGDWTDRPNNSNIEEALLTAYLTQNDYTPAQISSAIYKLRIEADTVDDICQMHKQWLGTIYTWAGVPRSVNLSKGGFDFAVARVIPALFDEFERQQLRKYTPCRFGSHDEIAHALAEVHVELMLIHPFREGNGRLGRLLATLMALQAGLPQLEFSEMIGFRREEYFASVRAGLDRNYQPMKKMFSDVIERSVWLWEES